MEKEYFSTDEESQLKILLAKQKRIQRQKKAEEKFFEEVDNRKAEILERWGISERGVGVYPDHNTYGEPIE